MKKIKIYKWLILCLLTVFLLFIIEQPGNIFKQKVHSQTIQEQEKTVNRIEVKLIAKINWNNVVDKSELPPPRPPGAATFEFRKPKNQIEINLLPRYGFMTFASPGGLASLIYVIGYKTLPFAILTGEETKIIKLPEDPISLSARSDGGVWVLHQLELAHYDATGKKVKAIDTNIGSRLVGVEGDGVWLTPWGYYPESVLYVNANGEVKGPYPWQLKDPFRGIGKSLCGWTYKQNLEILCLDPDGNQEIINFPHIKFTDELVDNNIERFRNVIYFNNQEVIIRNMLYLHHFNASGKSDKIFMAGTGLTASGEAFVSTYGDDNWTDVYISDGTKRRVPVTENNSTKSPYIPKIARVFAIDSNHIFVSENNYVLRYQGEELESSYIIDNEEKFEREIYARNWQRTDLMFQNLPIAPEITPDGTIILSVSGPSGFAIIGVRWNH
ncbi:MAG TPA: hypothetical protein VK184_03255 [Nostocaceae cyanobacterium]|nr:hypothetical protein [Nostocaceae cyanobacterium]